MCSKQEKDMDYTVYPFAVKNAYDFINVSQNSKWWEAIEALDKQSPNAVTKALLADMVFITNESGIKWIEANLKGFPFIAEPASTEIIKDFLEEEINPSPQYSITEFEGVAIITKSEVSTSSSGQSRFARL